MSAKINTYGTKLRFEFIGMAFALAIGQVGLEIGEFYSHGLHLNEHPYVLSHLFLGTYIIASSWVGWNKSKSKGNLESINNTFGKPFILLLIDLFLVICYFIMVKGVEKPYELGGQGRLSANFETFWAIIIMSTYCLWDILTKFIEFDSINFKISFPWKAYSLRAYQALICLILLLVIFLSNSLKGETSITDVIFTDVYIILVFILFRGMKEEISNPSKHVRTNRLKYFCYINLPLIAISIVYIILFYLPFLKF